VKKNRKAAQPRTILNGFWEGGEVLRMARVLLAKTVLKKQYFLNSNSGGNKFKNLKF
jgi:hypothetical protein